MYNAPNYLYLYNYYCIMILMMCNVDRKKFCLCYTSNIMSDIFNDSIIWFDNRIRLIRFIYYIYNYRLLYYLPMERMEDKEVIAIQYRKISELEEENKNLKDKIKHLEFDVDAWHQLKLLLEWEIEKLKEERIFSLGEYDYMILTSTTPQLKIIKKNQNYSLMEEDTLQELRDIGEI